MKMWDGTKLAYVAFKRLIWLAETCLLILIVLACYAHDIPHPWTAIMILSQFLRVLTELANHRDLTLTLGYTDRFWMVPFLLT